MDVETLLENAINSIAGADKSVLEQNVTSLLDCQAENLSELITSFLLAYAKPLPTDAISQHLLKRLVDNSGELASANFSNSLAECF